VLATSGAGVSVSRSLNLLAAEVCGYLPAIALLRLVLGSVMADAPIAGVLLRTIVSIYVLYLAALLWRGRAREISDRPAGDLRPRIDHHPLEPKAIIFTFLLLPLQSGRSNCCPSCGASRGCPWSTEPADRRLRVYTTVGSVPVVLV
jgi:threonine/homoserine/homoserine lactone efflux protein